MKIGYTTEHYALCCLAKDAAIPTWADLYPYGAIIRSSEEMTVICQARFVPDGVTCVRNWRLLKLLGRFDYTVSGVLARVVAPFAKADISVVAVPGFETDYLLVQQADFARSLEVLANAGHEIVH